MVNDCMNGDDCMNGTGCRPSAQPSHHSGSGAPVTDVEDEASTSMASIPCGLSTLYVRFRSCRQDVRMPLLPFHLRPCAFFGFEKISDFATVALSFVCNKYYPIVD